MITDYCTHRLANIRKHLKQNFAKRAFSIAGILFLGLPAMAQDNAPSFTRGAAQNLSTCFDAGAVSLSSLLAVSDPDTGQIEVWTIVSGPSNGVLSGFASTALSNGGTVLPSGLTYTPNAGYAGADNFTIQVSDGTLTATTTVSVTVHALPVLSSTLSPAAICDQSAFNYTPTSATGGAAFTWSRPFTGGISNPSATGSGSISETLMNITNYDIPVTYNYTTTANGCSSHQNVTVTVHPTPRLSSPLYDTTCTGGTYTYVPVAATPATTFSWSRASVSGISPATSSGTGNISEVLTNSNGTPTTVVYTFTLSGNGCTSVRNLNVDVLTTPPVTGITVTPPSTVCSGTMFQTFGASVPPPAGATYAWTAMNANVVATGNTGQYAVVNFPTPGNASVTLNVMMTGAHCMNNGTYTVTVSNDVAAPGAGILYYNFQLVYLDNTQSSYQWGYDDAATLEPHIISGAVFQSYPFGSLTPDFVNNLYWVMTTKDGCTQKTYFNAPTGISNVGTASAAGIKLFPNPASGMVNVVMDIPNGNTAEVTVSDMIGRAVKSVSVTGFQARLDVADLAPGCYFVTCSQKGVKLATARFIKN